MKKNVIGILIVLSIIGLATYAFAQRGPLYNGYGPGAHWSGYGHRGFFSDTGRHPFSETERQLRAEFSKTNPDPEKITDLRSEMRNRRNDRGYSRHGGRNLNSGWGRGPGFCWR